jgi:hypothetical protein
MDLETAQAIDNLSPGNQLYEVGTNIRTALDKRQIRQQQYVRYVDSNVSSSGDGKTWDKAFLTITEGITELNKLDGLGATLLIAPGYYIEVAADVPVLSASDCLIQGVGLPEDTVWYGSGTAGVAGASTDHLLTILGGNNQVDGLAMFTHKNDKACIRFIDTGGGYAGSYNVISNCYFPPLVQDLVGYSILYSGGTANQIINNKFYGCAVAAISMVGNVGKPIRNVISNNHFVGTTIGISVTDDNYNTLISDNWFSAGSETSEDMTNAINLSAGFTAGTITVMKNYFEQSAANDIADSKGGTAALIEMDNTNGA